MRKIIIAGVAAVAIGGVAAGAAITRAGAQEMPELLLAQAGAPPAPPQDAGPPAPGRPPGPPWMRWLRADRPPGPPGGLRTFALFYRPDDRHLTAPDVQKIAEAFLLWNGNRDWKVTQVAPTTDGLIGFAFATSEGGVIARFTMDSKTGRIARVG